MTGRQETLVWCVLLASPSLALVLIVAILAVVEPAALTAGVDCP